MTLWKYVTLSCVACGVPFTLDYFLIRDRLLIGWNFSEFSVRRQCCRCNCMSIYVVISGLSELISFFFTLFWIRHLGALAINLQSSMKHSNTHWIDCVMHAHESFLSSLVLFFGDILLISVFGNIILPFLNGWYNVRKYLNWYCFVCYWWNNKWSSGPILSTLN